MPQPPRELSLLNATRCATALLPASGDAAWTLIAKSAFDLHAGTWATRSRQPVALAAGDIPVEDADDATLLPPRYESDFVPFKPRADCLCVGTAYPPGGAATWCHASFGVGHHFDKTILVVGDRRWIRLDEQHVGATQPATFRTMALTFANAYGGVDAAATDATTFFSHNPCGKGYAVSAASAVGQPLPNLEDPVRPLQRWADRARPRAFGPVGRTCQPRLSRAGTFDEVWMRTRAPLPPEDFDEAYYNAAPDDQQVEDYLRGDEEIRLTHLHPMYPELSCFLPGVRVRAIVVTGGFESGITEELSVRETAIHLDTLWVDADALRVVLVWRGRILPFPSETRVLLAEERLEDPPRPLETMRQVLHELDVRAAEAARLEREADRDESEDHLGAFEDDSPDTDSDGL